MPDDDLTPAELAYLESGGAEVDALVAENPSVSTPPADAPATEPRDATSTAAEPGNAGAAGPEPQAVSYNKFRRTAERLETNEREISELREKYARGDERLRLLAQALTPQEEQQETEQDPEPNPQQDIFAHNAWLRRRMGKLQEAVGQTRETIEQRRAEESMRSNYQRDANEFERATPDFRSAYQHLLQTRAAMLAGQGYGEPEIRQILFGEERALVQRAFQVGKRPAEMVYQLAQQLGYRRPSATPAKPRPRAGSELSVETLVNMTDAEFAKLYSSRSKDIENLLGRRL